MTGPQALAWRPHTQQAGNQERPKKYHTLHSPMGGPMWPKVLTRSVCPDEEEREREGAYSKGPFAGFCRRTITHPNSARLFNALIKHICPGHKWASVSILFNSFLPEHIDHGNSREPNLVTSLSLHEEGDIWVECQGGTEFHEHSGTLVPGQRFPVQMQSIRFTANKRLHCTCAWTAFYRVLLTAYTPSRWDTLRAPLLKNLRQLGFALPQTRQAKQSLNLHHDCLPSVLRD